MKKVPYKVSSTLIILITIFICFIQLEFSTTSSLVHALSIEFKYIFLNMLTIGTILCIFYLLCNKIYFACLLCSIFCSLISIVNYYVIKYHALPLSFLEIKNFTTALNVISGYKISLDRIVFTLVFCMLVNIVICFLFRTLEPKTKYTYKALIKNITLFLSLVVSVYLCYFSPISLKPIKTITWSWNEAYYKYGYVACTIESSIQAIHPFNKPNGYSETALNDIAINNKNTESFLNPDIILILNETFYDPGIITDLKTDVPYLENIYTLDNTITGYAIVPAKGSTNSSEYELLTSNSLHLMPGITPFNTLDLTTANSIVSHLNALGYNTTGSHPEPGLNYSRSRGYENLGFKQIHFDVNFIDLEFYGTRHFDTDASVYKNLIRWYEEESSDAPQFHYLLTIQNHGAYEGNPPEMDTIHVLNDYGKYTEQMNEFLSCIKLSDDAFLELTQYFSDVERPVIICMMGDHLPNFASDIIDPTYSEEEANLLLRKVPLVIWANYKIKDINIDTISMNYVVPTLLELAEVKLSPYYQYMLDLREDIPILTSYGDYYDADGNLYKYNIKYNSSYEEAINNYFYLEYNNLQKKRIQPLFDPFK